jgi:hypothetical protein
MVGLTGASWNQFATWLKRIQSLRPASCDWTSRSAIDFAAAASNHAVALPVVTTSRSLPAVAGQPRAVKTFKPSARAACINRPSKATNGTG